MLKKCFSFLIVAFFTTISLFACPIKELERQFLRDSFEFEFDLSYITRHNPAIIEAYNKKRGKNVKNIVEVSRDFLVPCYLKFYHTKKMICSTQSVYYSKLFTEKGIRNYVIHAQKIDREKNQIVGSHDCLIYFYEGSWKMVDFTAAWSAFKPAKSLFSGFKLEDLSSRSRELVLKDCFYKDLKEKLRESSEGWIAVGYYDGNDQKDLGELSPDIEECLKGNGYMKLSVDGPFVSLSKRRNS